MFSFGNKDKSQQPLLSDDHLSTPPNKRKYQKHKSMGADPETGQSYLSKSTSNPNNLNNNITNNNNIVNNLDLPDINKIAISTSHADDEFDDDLHADSGIGSGIMPRDVLSDSEYVNTHPLENYEQRPIPIPIIDDVEDDDESQSIDDHNNALSESEREHTPNSLSHNDDDAASNKSLPLNIDSNYMSVTITNNKQIRSNSFNKDSKKSKLKSLFKYNNDMTTSELVHKNNIKMESSKPNTLTLSPGAPYNKGRLSSKKFKPRSDDNNYNDLPPEAIRAKQRKNKRKNKRDKRFENDEDDEEHKGYDHYMARYSRGNRGYNGVSMGYHRNRASEAAIESDFTSQYSSDDDHTGYRVQLKRWRQLQDRCCCCFKLKCCLEGSNLCKCCNGFKKCIKALIYYKWFVIAILFLVLSIFINIYSFGDQILKRKVNNTITDEIFENIGIKDKEFDLLLFTQIISIILIVMILLNLYLTIKFYKFKSMNIFLKKTERKNKKIIDRGSKRRERIIIQKQHKDNLYEFVEKIWNDFLIIHENFPYWIKALNVNLTKMGNITKNKYSIGYDQDDEKTKENINGYVTNLRKFYNTMKMYNKEIEVLILKKLKHDIEEEMHDDNLSKKNKNKNKNKNNNNNDNNHLMLKGQFDEFINKTPKKYRKLFNDEFNESNESISYDKIYALLNKLLENYNNLSKSSNDLISLQGITMTSDRLSTEPASISLLKGGFLAYGDEDLQFVED